MKKKISLQLNSIQKKAMMMVCKLFKILSNLNAKSQTYTSITFKKWNSCEK